jgi:ribonucleoside-triphosphate reductase
LSSNNSPFPSYYEQFIHVSRYARWREEDNRRETWEETVRRLTDYYVNHVSKLVPGWIPDDEGDEIYNAIYNLEVMPSMRALMTAGPALDRDHVAAYNCAYLVVDHPHSFDEAMYVLMCGTGVGYSVERKYTDKLPEIPNELHESDVVITVADSKIGWAKSFRQLIALLYSGTIPRWDVSRLRPAGARLKTFGGRASGPAPLVDLFEFTTQLFHRAAGRRLNTIECHDLMCKIADIVVVGGVRRSAMISLSDITDERMREAKMGEWWAGYGHRRLANNSAVYERHKPDMPLFMKEWKALHDSKSGERGIFSRYACQNVARRNERRDADQEFGTNPCSEIILRPFEFCNLSEVVCRPRDGIEELKRKVRLATILGTIQSTFTEFRYLRKIWQTNCEEERLLGVSLTGILDCPTLVDAFERGDGEPLRELRRVAVETNEEWAKRLGIEPSAAISCVKPSGTVSQLVNSRSGMHGGHSRYYIRTIRADIKDPLTSFLIEAGVPNEVDVMNPNTIIFSFPKEAPAETVMRDDWDAIKNLEFWKFLQENWCEHKPSVTISVKDDEWMKVGAWVYENFDILSGVSFLPYDGGSYKQAPYQEITEAEYKDWVENKMPKDIDWDKLREFEKEDTTTGSQELACVAGYCEVVSIGDV